MDVSWETLDNYRKNLLCLREVTDGLLGRMMGHDTSFRPEITDKKGRFSPEKLRAFVEELLSGWEELLRSGTDTAAGEPYLRARRELYGLYLYLTMRCSLCEGADACGGGGRTDFAFLLEQAKRLSSRWCVITGPGGKTNEPYEGFDAHFGFHLYQVLTDPEGSRLDSTLTPCGTAPADRPGCLTDEGNMKRIYLKGLSSPAQAAEEPERGAGVPAASGGDRPENVSGDPYDTDEDRGGYDDYDDYGDDSLDAGWDQPYGVDLFDGTDGPAEETSWRANLAGSFEGREEYLGACRRFRTFFEGAGPEVLRGFYEELEEIVNLYLLRRGAAPLADTDMTLDIYGRVYDGPGRQAKRYARGLQWNSF